MYVDLRYRDMYECSICMFIIGIIAPNLNELTYR